MHGRCTADTWQVHGKSAWQKCIADVIPSCTADARQMHGRCAADACRHVRCHAVMPGRCMADVIPLMHGRCMQAWQMAPYVEAVLRQQRSQPLIRAAAKLLQARHERTRTRTLERSLMHLQQLAEAPSQPLPPVMTRLRSASTLPCWHRCACVSLCTLGVCSDEAHAAQHQLGFWMHPGEGPSQY